MRCSQCDRFDRENRVCQDGKINPQTYAEAIEATNVLGVRAVCIFNDFRERLISNRQLPMRMERRKQ